MPAKPTFTPEQRQVIHAAAKRVWKAKFAWMKKTDDRPGGQEAMALALGVTQQTVSNLLKGTYHPGAAVAAAIANLDGQTLEQLVGDFNHPEPENVPAPAPQSAPESFSNLTTCIAFYASTKHWSPWTIAAARAGYFGLADFAPPEWADKLDALERTMEKGRKTA